VLCASAPLVKDAVTSLAYLTEWSKVAEEPKQKIQSTSISRPSVSAPHVLVCTPALSAMSIIYEAEEREFGAARQII
jgi:hypothetical protein